MKHVYILIAFAAILGLATSCKSAQSVSTTTKTAVTTSVDDINYLRKITDNNQYAQNITSKVKFNAGVGGQNVSLSGNLKMRRDDVIQISLVALGFVEAARFEFTPEYALIIDRLHKSYVKEKYDDIAFLKDNGLNFYSLQALFWNELFCPGQNQIDESKLSLFTVSRQGDMASVTLRDEAKPNTAVMKTTHFKWGTNKGLSKITSAVVSYDDAKTKAQMSWNYSDFKTFSRKPFPMVQAINIATQKLKLKAEMTLSNPDNNSDWDNRTNLSGKYNKVSVEEFFSNLVSL